jgi:hypothetical protein
VGDFTNDKNIQGISSAKKTAFSQQASCGHMNMHADIIEQIV